MTDDFDDLIHETEPATPNFRTELAAQLEALVPEAIADGKVDVEKLKELLADDVADQSERFGLFWPGKKRAMRAAQEPTTATLRPDFENSKDWDSTKNVFIEGDNLEVLKILQKHYHSKIKMIYIDPPYNTGKDFVYPDNFKEGLETYLEWTEQVKEGKKVGSNSETEGRYHSNWLNMMYPRLKLARNLLTEDGVIFISIDGHEVANLRRVCDEVFGAGCFKNMIAVRRGIKNVQAQFDDVDSLSAGHEYVLLYSRNSQARLPKLSLNHSADKPGKWDTFWRGTDRPTMRYELLGIAPKSGQWRWERERTHTAVQNYQEFVQSSPLTEISLDEYYLEHLAATNVKLNFVRKNEDEVVQYYVPPSSGKLLSDNWMDLTLSGSATEDFDTEKSVGLMRRMIEWVTGDGDIVLDFFGGSGTTGEGVYRANSSDDIARRWIQVQLPEPTPEKSTAREAGIKSISEIARRRLASAAGAIAREFGTLNGVGPGADLGFRAYRLADTSFAKWRVSSDVELTTLEQHLFDLRESADNDATADDLLTEILLKQGYSLTESIAPVEIGGLHLRSVGDGIVLAYLNEHVKPTLDQLRELMAAEPARLIVLEDAFQGDDELKTNLFQLCKSRGIELWTV